jgi:hypothetical protein
MAIHHIGPGEEMRVVGPAKVDVTGDLEEYMKVKPFVLARPPVLNSIDPNSAEIGGPQITLRCIGAYFMPESVIVFNGGVEPTVFVSATELTTLVTPTTAGTPGSYPVLVRTFTHETAPQSFSFTDPAPEGTRRKR